MHFLQLIGKGIVVAGIFLGGLLNYHQGTFGTTVYKPVPRYESSLALALDSVTTSSMTLVSGVDGNGMTLSGPMCFTLDSGVSGKVEDVCGTAAGTVVSGLLRGTDSSGYTSSSTLAKSHRVGANVKTTDSPYLPQYYGFLNGSNAFPNPLIYDSAVTNALIAAKGLNLVDYNLLASTSIAGAANASEILNGIVQAGTLSQTIQGTSAGSTGALLFPQNKYFTATSTATTSLPIANYLQGSSYVLSPTFLPTSTPNVTWTGTTTFSGNVTFSSNITIPSTPVNSTDAASKNYVDTQPTNKIAVYATSTTITGINTAVEVASTSIAAGTLSTNNAIRATMYFDNVNYDNVNGNLTFWFRFGTTDMSTTTFTPSSIVGGNGGPVKMVIEISANSSTTAQRAFTSFVWNRTNTPNLPSNATTTYTNENFFSYPSLSVNSNQNQTLSFYIQYTAGSGHASNTATSSMAIFEKIK